jgi:Zn-dependent protease with chaperone function
MKKIGFMSIPASVIIHGFVPYVIKSIFMRWREGKADDFAITHSSDSELLGGKYYFEAIQLLNNDIAAAKKSYFVSSKGESYLDLSHPSLESRIQKIQEVLTSKNITVDQDKENIRVKKIRSIWAII